MPLKNPPTILHHWWTLSLTTFVIYLGKCCNYMIYTSIDQFNKNWNIVAQCSPRRTIQPKKDVSPGHSMRWIVLFCWEVANNNYVISMCYVQGLNILNFYYKNCTSFAHRQDVLFGESISHLALKASLIFCYHLAFDHSKTTG